MWKNMKIRTFISGWSRCDVNRNLVGPLYLFRTPEWRWPALARTRTSTCLSCAETVVRRGPGTRSDGQWWTGFNMENYKEKGWLLHLPKLWLSLLCQNEGPVSVSTHIYDEFWCREKSVKNVSFLVILNEVNIILLLCSVVTYQHKHSPLSPPSDVSMSPGLLGLPTFDIWRSRKTPGKQRASYTRFLDGSYWCLLPSADCSASFYSHLGQPWLGPSSVQISKQNVISFKINQMFKLGLPF